MDLADCEQNRSRGDLPTQEVIITLVHGTWGRGFIPNKAKRWFNDGSQFRTSFDSHWNGHNATAPQTEVFEWSGSNSICERDKAGLALAEFVRAQHSRVPDKRQVIVAHSHGGNVALRAVHYLQDEASSLLIATMACPFLEIFPSNPKSLPTTRYAFLVLTALFIPLILAIIGFSAAVYKSVLAIMLLMGVGYVFIERRSQLARRQGKILNSFETRMAMLTSHESYELSGAQLFVLRGVDDEAGLALAAAALAGLASRWCTSAIEFVYGNTWFSLILAIGSLALSYWLSSLGYFPLNWSANLVHGDSYSTLVGMLSFWLFPVGFLWVVTAFQTIWHSLYGRELFLKFPQAEVSVNSVPDCKTGVVIRTLIRGNVFGGPLRHSLYNESMAASSIATWLSAVMKQRQIRWSERGRRVWPHATLINGNEVLVYPRETDTSVPNES